ncbi:putative LOC103383965 isoform X1 [Cynoglossus semilaevis]|uniref:putative LOC103383965 isoform X1 n=1 Tax=Cynoglossus semilaevis TaxID=244447 RepID=UPI0007DCB234|nr:uncharacterized LOC103383965 isoform X1 [Cynoglossus semilaevis]
MALIQNSPVLLLFVVAAIYIQLDQAQNTIPGRCWCPKSVKFTKGNMTDFQVLERHPGCDKTELIVTMAEADNSTAQICINTQGKMAKNFLKCWERIKKEESRKMECINKRRKTE